MSDVDVVRVAVDAMRNAPLAARRELSAPALAALDRLVAERPEDRRKIEAYDAARATVKTEGNSRAFYVLRAEKAEAERDEAVEALRLIASHPHHGLLKNIAARALASVDRRIGETP